MNKQNDSGRFMIAMNAMSAVFGVADLSKPKLALMFEALEDIRIETLEAACKEILRNETKFPVPKTIRDYSNKVSSYVEPQPKALSYREIKPNTELGKDCMANITALLEGKVSKKEYLIEASRICDKYGLDDNEWISEQWESADGKA